MMLWAAVLSVMSSVTLISLLIVKRSSRRPADAAAVSTLRPRPRSGSWMSTLTLPGIMSYWAAPLGAYWVPTEVVRHADWQDCQLVLVTTANDDVVLDCLVPTSTGEGCRSQACVPMTLRAHQLPRYQSSSDALHTLENWVRSDSFVDIEVDGDAGMELVRIFVANRLITLELLQPA